MPDKTTFVQVTEIHTGGLDDSRSEPVDGVLLVATRSVARWTDGHDSCGEWAVALWPAVSQGKHCWLLEERWCAALGYTAEGTRESILPLVAGIELAVERGALHHIFGEPVAV